jgi:hypothetical protein
MKFTAATIILAAASVASAQRVVIDARGLDDILSSITSKVSSKFESVTEAVNDGKSSFSSVKTAFNEASASAKNQANPSGFTFPAVKTATADADKLYAYITSVDKFIPTKVVDEWKDGETPSAVASFVKELPEKYTAAAKDGWSSLSSAVKKETSTASAKKDDDKKDDKKDDDDDDEKSGAVRQMGVAASVAIMAGLAGMAIIL